MARRITVILNIVMMCSTAAAQVRGGDEAYKAYRDGDYDTAIAKYTELLEDRTQDPKLRFNLADAFYKKEAYNAARADFTDALKSDDASVRSKAFYNLGNTLFKMGKTEEALKLTSRL